MANIELEIKTKGLEEAIEKAKQLNELLEQAQTKIDSLSKKESKEIHILIGGKTIFHSESHD